MPKPVKSEGLTGQDAVDYIHETRIVEVDVSDALMSKEVRDTLDKVMAAKADKFKDMAPDFWKPGGTDKAGKPYPKKIRGLYLGWQRGAGKLIQHAVGQLDPKGKPCALRFNGTAALTRELKKIPRGEWGTIAAGIEIEFLGQGPTTMGANPHTGELEPRQGMKEFRVTRLEE